MIIQKIKGKSNTEIAKELIVEFINSLEINDNDKEILLNLTPDNNLPSKEYIFIKVGVSTSTYKKSLAGLGYNLNTDSE